MWNSIIPIVSIVCTSGVSILVVKITSKSERKKIIFENKKEIYIKTLKILHNLRLNPDKLMEDSSMDNLQDLVVELNIFGSEEVVQAFKDYANFLSASKCDIEKKISKETSKHFALLKDIDMETGEEEEHYEQIEPFDSYYFGEVEKIKKENTPSKKTMKEETEKIANAMKKELNK